MAVFRTWRAIIRTIRRKSRGSAEERRFRESISPGDMPAIAEKAKENCAPATWVEARGRKARAGLEKTVYRGGRGRIMVITHDEIDVWTCFLDRNAFNGAAPGELTANPFVRGATHPEIGKEVLGNRERRHREAEWEWDDKVLQWNRVAVKQPAYGMHRRRM